MKGINNVILVGRLTKDVEVRKTQTGLSVASFTIAVDRKIQSKDPNAVNTDFISCVVWRQGADFLGQYAHKGTLIGLEGSIQTRNYTDKDDPSKKVYVTEVMADSVQILEKKSDGTAPTAAAPAPAPVAEAAPDIANDDLPF